MRVVPPAFVVAVAELLAGVAAVVAVAALAGCQGVPRAAPVHVVEDTACARGADGVWCARFEGARFGDVTRWTRDFGDAQGFGDESEGWTTLRTPDLDGDGRTDVCLLGRVAVVCALRVAPAAFGPPVRSVLFDGAVDDAHAAGSFALPDVDGDGHPDVCLRSDDGLHCALGAGDGSFAAATTWATWPFAVADGAAEPVSARSLRFADVDGDGRDDVCLRKSEAIVCARSTGSGFATATPWTGALWDSDGARPIRAELDLADLDGDGRADLCLRDAVAGVRCLVSTGSAFAPFGGAALPAGAAGLRLGDVDGDGHADVCVWQAAGLFCARGSAHGLGPLAAWESSLFAAPRFVRADARSLALVDVDGDGRADACGRTRDGLGCALSNGAAFALPSDSGAFGDGIAAWHDRPDIAALAIGRRTQPSGSVSNRTARENELPGASDWWIPYPQWSMAHEVEAYTDATSYPAGASVGVMLSTQQAGDGVAWTLLRTGWYGGFGARVLAGGRVIGNPQPLLPAAAGAHAAAANWKQTFRVPLPKDAVSGVYALRLDSEASGKSFFVTFVVREDRRSAALVVNRADYTDAAYNDWDGAGDRSSAYLGAMWVTLDRPLRSIAALNIYAWSSGYFVYEYPMVRWLESQGYDVKYVSDVDLDAQPQPLAGARAFLSVGHDEYWSPAKRDHVEAARDAGVHLAFFGSDAVDGRIRFADRKRRTFSRTISDKDPHKLEYGALPLDATRPAHENPSDELIGTHYGGWCDLVHTDCKWDPPAKLRHADELRIVAPAHPIFRGLDGKRTLPGVLGYEYEVPYAQPNLPLPFTVQTLARAAAIDLGGGAAPVMVTYRASSGARVVNIGSMHWTLALDDWTGRAALRQHGVGDEPCTDGAADCFVRPHSTAAAQITTNILVDFGAVPATPSPELTESAPAAWP